MQAVICNITDAQAEYVTEVEEFLQDRGFRAESDLRNEKIGFKIREHTLKRIPYLVVIGDKEVENNELAVRSLSGKNMGNFTPEDFIALLAKNIAERNKLEP